ncbi:ER membrane protein complex subunit 7-like protein [Psilocybe cubensis]|uniref:ER membrane protein complex subunit 7 beta-sandwich domain-containing protein n=2 Tax=Psilocybe cubensis TaxID=181762 RepID=A0A8H8CQN6_PSICU|nr:ER membrane protein complex subunit 7-like protein [Psilocybe cubensis]KAH9486758.1 ER membrane protein complex subunit 7-like protein [Psilocybe cubensis]
MTRISLFLLQLLSCVVVVFSFDITGKVLWNDECPDTTALGQAKVSLNEGILTGGITRNGEFTIPDVPWGTYILTILAHDYYFDQVRIDVSNSTSPEVRPYVAGTPMDPPSTIFLPYPISLTPREKYVYFVPPERFNLAGMLANPMMLLMVGGGVMMLAMPYLIKNLDPEALEELKEQQGKMGSIQNAFQNGDFKSGFSSLMAAADQPAQASPSKAGGAAKARGNKKAKR